MAQEINDLDVEIETVLSFFQREQTSPYVLVKMKESVIAQWQSALGTFFRRCYITDTAILDRFDKLGVPIKELIAGKLPNPGSTMSGDFGEILAYLFQSCDAVPLKAIGPKKWRLKQDRTKPSPYSDVVHFILPEWPKPSAYDQLLCAEVKTKATAGTTSPIENAIRDCEKDRISRLAKTLEWLHDRALYENLDDVGLAEIDRFREPDKYPSFKKDHRAIVVICSTLLDSELNNAPTIEPSDYSVVIISVPNLKDSYTAVYESAVNSSIYSQEISGEQ